MAYRVRLLRRAELDLDRIFQFIDASGSLSAARWFNGLEVLIQSLERLPQRGMVTNYDRHVHFLLYGNKPHIYQILYRINEASKTVSVSHIRHIRHIRHGARKPLQSL